MRKQILNGAGLGLRRELLAQLLPDLPKQVDFWELAPENWIPFVATQQDTLRPFSEQSKLVAHGLSLSIGSPAPLDVNFVKQVKRFLDSQHILYYSEHLSYCSGAGHMYDLMPIPFTEEAVAHVVSRVTQVQDILQRPLLLENISYYAAPGQQISELDFTLAVLEQADCMLMLDVNNVYVNSINHGYDAKDFIAALPSEKIIYGHVAGHYDEADDLKIDTHGAPVIDPVWQLLAYAYQQHGVFPTLLERDFNFPPLAELLGEVDKIKHIQSASVLPLNHAGKQLA